MHGISMMRTEDNVLPAQSGIPLEISKRNTVAILSVVLLEMKDSQLKKIPCRREISEGIFATDWF